MGANARVQAIAAPPAVSIDSRGRRRRSEYAGLVNMAAVAIQTSIQVPVAGTRGLSSRGRGGGTEETLELIQAIENLETGRVEAGEVDRGLDARGSHADAIGATRFLVVAFRLAGTAYLAGRVSSLAGIEGSPASSWTLARTPVEDAGVGCRGQWLGKAKGEFC